VLGHIDEGPKEIGALYEVELFFRANTRLGEGIAMPIWVDMRLVAIPQDFKELPSFELTRVET
jgi:hypothetical protein